LKFCFFGYDYTIDIAQRLIDDGHELLHIFSFPCDNRFSFNTELHNIAKYYNISVSETPAQQGDIEALIQEGCALFLSAGYPYKLPVLDEETAHGLNIHPSYLPQARGVMPLPHIIAKDPSAAGFSIHKHSNKFDGGDILYQERIEIDTQTDIETLSAHVALRCPDAMSKVAADLGRYWANAKPQDETKASLYFEPKEPFRNLDWNDDVQTLLQKGRAFGRFGILARIENRFGQSQTLAVYNFTGWAEEHNQPTGTIIRSSAREIILAVKDGYILLKEFEIMVQ